jgi:hypothetical protein
VSDLSNAIVHIQGAADQCEDVLGALARSDQLLAGMSDGLVQGLADTPHLELASQLRETAGGHLGAAVQSVQQLARHLRELVARFQPQN